MQTEIVSNQLLFRHYSIEESFFFHKCQTGDLNLPGKWGQYAYDYELVITTQLAFHLFGS
jgi:hypothetical protein